MKIYMEITQDEYQLPLKVADSPVELAKICGITTRTVYNYLYLTKKGVIKNPRYIKVVIDD